MKKDIRKYTSIDNTKKFCLDTNVLYWYTYPRFTESSFEGRKRVQIYYEFVDQLVAAGNPLLTTRYNLTELINIIEKHEFDIFKEKNNLRGFSKKDYRKISQERENLKKILKTTLANVYAVCKVVDFNFTEKIINECIETLNKHRCDVFDFAIVSYYKENGYLNIITDDGDFSTIDGINLYTANDDSLE